MKPLNIFFFSLLYFLFYLTISLGIDLYFDLETSFPALIGIGFVFEIFLIVLLVFDVPDKIAEKIHGKCEEEDNEEEGIVCNDPAEYAEGDSALGDDEAEDEEECDSEEGDCEAGAGVGVEESGNEEDTTENEGVLSREDLTL